MKRPSRALAAAALASLLSATAHAAEEPITVLKTSGCGCCLGWMKRLEEAGYQVTGKNVSMGELMQTKLKAGLTVELTSCHTGQVARYVVEGHVPVREIRRLLDERPQAIGLTVPGMPLGSPGMEAGGERRLTRFSLCVRTARRRSSRVTHNAFNASQHAGAVRRSRLPAHAFSRVISS